MRPWMLAALLLPLLPTEAEAASWYWVGGNDATSAYVDLDSLRPIGGKIIAVTHSVYAKAFEDQTRAVSIRSEFDCAGGYFRTLEYSYFGPGGRLTSSEPSETINERKVPAKESINEAFMDFICYRKGGSLVSDPFGDAQGRFGKR